MTINKGYVRTYLLSFIPSPYKLLNLFTYIDTNLYIAEASGRYISVGAGGHCLS